MGGFFVSARVRYVGLVDSDIDHDRSRMLAGLKTSGLLRLYAGILVELRERGVIRTNNAPLGDYAEHLAFHVYGGALAPNSEKAFDILDSDNRRVQIKACSWGSNSRSSTAFSVFRSLDFTVATFLLVDADTYRLLWARELTADQVRENASWSSHVNGWRIRVAAVEREGIDVSERFVVDAG